MYHKSQSYKVWFLRYGVWQTEFCVILDCFLPFNPTPTPLITRKIKTLKKWKKLLEILFYTFVSQWQSYDIWLLRYRAQQTEFFVILDHFLPFYNPKNQNFKNLIKSLKISSFYTSVSKIMIKCYIVPEIWHVTDVIVTFHFRLFFALLLA